MPEQPMTNPIDQIVGKINEHAGAIELGILRSNQQQQILDQHRVTIYNNELKFNLLLKILEEKGVLVKDEFDKRWPLYLKNDIGVLGPNGRMEGAMKVTFYDGGIQS